MNNIKNPAYRAAHIGLFKPRTYYLEPLLSVKLAINSNPNTIITKHAILYPILIYFDNIIILSSKLKNESVKIVIRIGAKTEYIIFENFIKEAYLETEYVILAKNKKIKQSRIIIRECIIILLYLVIIMVSIMGIEKT